MVEIRPLIHLDASVRVPGSKSIAQRAMVIAALADGESRLADCLAAEDTDLLGAALAELGARIRPDGPDLVIAGTGGRLVRPAREIHLGNNGTAMRLLAGIASLGPGPVTLTGSPRLCERPMQPLNEALAALGAPVRSTGRPGCPPVILQGGGLRGGSVVLRDIGSSQYVSSLLIAAPYAANDVTLKLEGTVPSLPYVALTIETMGAFGVQVEVDGVGGYRVAAGQRYQGRTYPIEGDVSSASYFFAAAVLVGGRICVENIDPHTHQGDIAFLDILARLGCRVDRGGMGVEVTGGEMPTGEMTFDMGSVPDMVPTLAVLAAVRPGTTLIRNCAHLRLKESDRLAALVTELRKTGIAAAELNDGIAITGGRPHEAVIDSHNDHRIVMAFAVLGLAIPGMRIAGEACVAKSFPGFWDTLQGIYPDTRGKVGQTEQGRHPANRKEPATP
jgi:3-phosphoshikimate 1-carboxyvinyltransferase